MTTKEYDLEDIEFEEASEDEDDDYDIEIIKVKQCCMCNRPAQFISPDTEEYLCEYHAQIDNEIRKRKMKKEGK